jgi:RHS repeat-associated protein
VGDKLGYTGHAHDFETDLTYMQARFYDPQVGRFMSADPVEFGGEDPFVVNRYVYANNNPYRYIDPTGTCTGSNITNGDGTCASTGGNTTDTAGAAQGMTLKLLGFVGAARVVGTSVAGLVGGAIAMTLWSESLDVPEGEGSGDDLSGWTPSGPDDEEPETKLVTNPKHHQNSSSPQPKNVAQLYRQSIRDKTGVRWTKDAEGVVHRFSKPSNGETHWNGSTAPGPKAVQLRNIPIEIRRVLGVK